MKLTKTTLALATGMSIALGACADNDVEEVDMIETEEVVVADEFDPMTRDYTLNEDATTRRAAFDADAFDTEYRGYRDDIMAESDDAAMKADGRSMEDGDNMSGDAGKDGAMAGSANMARDANSNMMSRSDMRWSYLDRNSDGQLSVAEYAIWAVPLDPNAPKANDETKPYTSADQTNKAADSFFYYDIDGDTYLSQREFSSARRGETFDS